MTEVGKEREPARAFTSSAVSLFCTMNCARSPTIFELGVTCTTDVELVFMVHTSVADPNPGPDPTDPRVFGPPGYGSISQRYGSGSRSFNLKAKIVRKSLISSVLLLLFDFSPLKMM
jgi:hypothetical protein